MTLNMSANLEDPAVATDWERSIFIPVPKKGSTKECANHQSHSFPSLVKVMLRILYAILHLYVNQELPNVQAEFRKS